MALLLDSARMDTSTTGTGTVTLGSAIDKYFTFDEAGAVDGQRYRYRIEDGDDVEIGVGTYTSSGTTFSRDAVLASKISGTAGTSKINLSGSAEIAIVAASQDIQRPEVDRALALTMLQAARNASLPIYTQERLADHFDVTTLVDTAGATNLSTATASTLRPTSTETRTTGGTPTTPNFAGTPANINDNNTGTTSAAAVGNLSAVSDINNRIYCQIDYGSEKTFTRLEVQDYVYSAGSGTIQGIYYSTNGTSWTLAGAKFAASTSPADVNRSGTFVARYVAVILDQVAFSNTVTIADLNAYETPYDNVEVASAAITAPSTVYSMSGLILVEETDAATAGTDYTLEFSADGGSNWETADLIELYSLVIGGGTVRVVEAAETPIANTGTSVKWRFSTVNNDNVTLHGVHITYR